MKKLSVLSLLMCVGSLTLAGCNNNPGGGGKKTTTGGATTSDTGSTGTTTGGTSGTSGTSSSSGPVVPTDWDDAIKSSMQELLDGVVLPYVPASWTAQSVGLPFGVVGDGVDLATVQAAFEQAGYKASSIVSGNGVTPLEKDSEHGVVGVGLISASATKVAIGATYLPYQEAWSTSDLGKFASKFGEGITIPFARGYWTVSANPNWCSLSAYRINNGGTADIIAAYEAAEGWTFKEYDAQQNPVYSYATTDGSTLEVNINVYNLRTYCDFSYVPATCEEWSAEDITFMNEHLAGGVLPHPAGLWSHPAIENSHVFTQEPLATTTLVAIKDVFEAAGFLVAVDDTDPDGYMFTKLAPELDEEDNPQYINGWIWLYGGIPAVEAYVGAPKVTDEFELFASASSVHSGDQVTLTLNMGNVYTEADVPEFSVEPVEGAAFVSSEGNQYVYQINAAADSDVTITASIREGSIHASVTIHVEDESVQTDWEDPIATSMETALGGLKIPYVAGEWEETTMEGTDYALRAPVASVETSAIASALEGAGYTYAGEQEGSEIYYLELAEGTLFVGYSSDEEYVTLFAAIQVADTWTAEEAANAIAEFFDIEFTDYSSQAGFPYYSSYLAYLASSVSVDTFKNSYVPYIVNSLLGGDFEALGDWTASQLQDETPCEVRQYSCDGVIIQFTVYSTTIQEQDASVLDILVVEPNA